MTYKTGSRGNALCETCQGKVEVTYQQRNVPLSNRSATVPNVLVGVCDTCDNVTTLPHQSVQRVADFIMKQGNRL